MNKLPNKIWTIKGLTNLRINYSSKDEAIEAAKKLADKNPGTFVHLLETVGFFHSEITPVKQITL